MKKSRNGKKKVRKSKLKGGDISYDAGGTGGSIGTLAENIVGTIIYTINSVINSVGVVTDLVELPSDMGTAFSAKNAPNPNNIDIKG